MTLWQVVMASTEGIDGTLLPEDELRWEALYDLVYMGQPIEADASERAVGLKGEGEVRAQLKEMWSQPLRLRPA